MKTFKLVLILLVILVVGVGSGSWMVYFGYNHFINKASTGGLPIMEALIASLTSSLIPIGIVLAGFALYVVGNLIWDEIKERKNHYSGQSMVH